jgi:hypothetical protein
MIIPIQNHWAYDRIPRNKDLQLSIKYTCNSPSRVLLIDHSGDCFVCGCEAWLPISLGKITDFSALEQIWQHPTAQTLQQQIDQGTFDHCAVTRCGVQYQDQLQDHYTVSINIDESCNLWCPSCRPGKVMITAGADYEKKLHYVNHIVDLLENFDQPTKIIMSGNGDVLASSIMRPLVHKFRPRQNHQLKLFTNGLLLRKQLADNPVIDHISEYLMSIDAGSKEVYEKIRLGGKWEVLLDNFDFLKAQARKDANIAITLVLQYLNYRDLFNYCDLGIKYGFHIGITRLENWASWKPQEFDHANVLDAKHPNYIDAVDELIKVIDRYGNRIGMHPGVLKELYLPK